MSDELSTDDLDLIWVALRDYVRKNEGRGDKTEAELAHNLSRKVRTLRDRKGK